MFRKIRDERENGLLLAQKREQDWFRSARFHSYCTEKCMSIGVAAKVVQVASYDLQSVYFFCEHTQFGYKFDDKQRRFNKVCSVRQTIIDLLHILARANFCVFSHKYTL